MDQGVELHLLLVHMFFDDHMVLSDNTELLLSVWSK